MLKAWASWVFSRRHPCIYKMLTVRWRYDPIPSYPSARLGGVSLMNNALSELHSWSKESNLALNPDKTKSMMFSTRQMFTRRNLSSFPLLLSAGRKDLERVKNTKLLGVHLDENLLWDEHVKNIIMLYYSRKPQENTFQDTAARIFNTLPSGTKSLWTANNFQNRPLRLWNLVYRNLLRS